MLFLSISVAARPQSSQTRKPGRPPWKEPLTPAGKGTQIPVPESILKDLLVRSKDCPDASAWEPTKVDAYPIKRGQLTLIAVWGRSLCYCGATGNCEFWLYELRQGEYVELLERGLVLDFVFLGATPDSLPNLVTWSHDSAERSPGNLLRFDGKEYVEVCGWELVRSFKELPDHTWAQASEHIESNSCEGYGPNGQRLQSKR